MCMGFKDPVHDQRMVAHEREHAVGRGGRGAGTGGIVVEHRVDDGGMATVTIVDHVGEGERGRVVKALDLRIHLTAPCSVRSEEHPSELQSLMRISYAVSCLKPKIEHNR